MEKKDIVWLNPDGKEMTNEQWLNDFARCLGVYLAGAGINERDSHGRLIADDDFLMLLNAYHEEILFQLPDFGYQVWQVLIDTTVSSVPPASPSYRNGDSYRLQGRSLILLTHARKPVIRD